MLFRSSQLWVILCLFLYFSVAVVGLLDPVRRQDAPSSTTTLSPAESPSPTDGGDGGKTTSPAETAKESAVPSTSSTLTTNSTATSVSSLSPAPTIVNGTGSLNTTLFNATIPAGELPLEPRITPGWAVSGVIMLCTGTVYTLIGIKMRWLHTLFSTSFLASLSTAVLILYVMVPPISDAIQGAYVVAIVCTGLILGGAAIVFKEITEGLGCLLGGFCLSMWLLTLQPGGLLPSTGAKVVFISAFTIAAFAFYFSRWTRTYALIGSISFSGATVSVLGIDCFSRAGLKEFWAYIWDLNDNLFPLGADTYPLTRGMRVELALTILIFLAGIVSQLKLWRIIKERRAKRDTEMAEGERNLQQEEENVGRQIEAANAHERGEWEAVYGDGERQIPRSSNTSADSGIGDLESEKRMRNSHGTTTTRSRPQSVAEEPIEMSELPANEEPPAVPPKPRPAAEIVMSHDGKDGMVTVRVARDDVLEWHVDGKTTMDSQAEQKAWAVGEDGEDRLAPKQAKRQSSGKAAASSPDIIPLPFKVPDGQHGSRDDDRSSFATFADEDDERDASPSKRSSFAKRLSQGSVDLLRSLSQRSKRGVVEKGRPPNQSREQLVVSRTSEHGEDDGSVAATIDGMSSDGDDADTVRDAERRRSIEINAQLADDSSAQLHPPTNTKFSEKRRTSTAETASTDVLNASEAGDSIVPRSNVSHMTELALRTEATTTEKDTADTTMEDGRSASASDAATKKAKSVASVDSMRASLTKERLPRALSRIALSYRTNEWAKHLSNAEAPEPDTLQLNDYPEEVEHMDNEEAVPVNVTDLQKTAENAAPPPAAPRSASVISSYPTTQQPSPIQTLSRSNSRQTIAFQAGAQTPEPQTRNSIVASGTTANPTNPYQNYPHPYRSMSGTLNRRTSGLVVEPIVEENDNEPEVTGEASPVATEPNSGSNSMSPSPIPPDPSAPTMSVNRPPVPGVVSYSSPQTLIGRREMFLRNKSQGSFVGSAATPEPLVMPTIPSQPNSEAGSLYNYPIYATGLGSAALGPSPVPVDMDDLPMSQRRELMRHNSLMSLSASRPGSGIGFNTVSVPAAAADGVPFDSHQPRRVSYLPTPAAREAQLASFRNSVAADLRAGTPIMPSAATPNGRETPLLASAFGGSTPSLPAYGRDAEVRQGIDAQRSFLMGQKEAEAKRREIERVEREKGDRAFEERMRRGDLLEAHRDAMRRLQAGARDG